MWHVIARLCAESFRKAARLQLKLNSEYTVILSHSVSSAAVMDKRDEILCLFDVDGTLTAPMKVIESDLEDFLQTVVKQRCNVGIVGGSDLPKILRQMGGENAIHQYDYVFAENGLIAYKKGHQIGKQSIQKHIGEENLQEFINFSLHYMSQLKLPVKRGTFIEFRTGVINVCPVGRSCSYEERLQFAEYDAEHKVREKFVKALRDQFPNLGLVYAIGGQISIDAFPKGWDKTFCLNHLMKENFKEIHFFGDKTFEGGNDYEIFKDERTIGHTVGSPKDTKKLLEELLKLI